MQINNHFHSAHHDRLMDAGIEIKINQPTNVAVQVAKYVHQQQNHQMPLQEQSFSIKDNNQDQIRNRLYIVITTLLRLFSNS